MDTCLNRLIGRCRDCSEDMDPSHHPNNTDCPMFRPVALLTFEVLAPEKKDEFDHKDLPVENGGIMPP